MLGTRLERNKNLGWRQQDRTVEHRTTLQARKRTPAKDDEKHANLEGAAAIPSFRQSTIVAVNLNFRSRQRAATNSALT